MNTEKLIKEYRVTMIIAFVIGVALFITGMAFKIFDIKLIQNTKAIIGLSFIPLAVAFVSYIKLRNLVKSPQKMQSTIVSETDERLVLLKNEADAKAFKILQSAVILTYVGYMLAVPEDIFVSVGWWILIGLFFLSFIAQSVLREMAIIKDNANNEEE